MMQVYAGGASVVLETNQGAFYLDDHSKTIKPKKSGVRINKHMQRQATRKAAIARVNLSEVNSQGKAYTAHIHQHARNHPLTTTIKSAWQKGSSQRNDYSEPRSVNLEVSSSGDPMTSHDLRVEDDRAPSQNVMQVTITSETGGFKQATSTGSKFSPRLHGKARRKPLSSAVLSPNKNYKTSAMTPIESGQLTVELINDSKIETQLLKPRH